MESKDKGKRTAAGSGLEFEASTDSLINAVPSAAYNQGGAAASGADASAYVGFSNGPKPAVIKVIGVGGGGCNAVNSMVADGVAGVRFVAINTDQQSLLLCDTDERITIGQVTTGGLGAGSNPEVGRKAIEESQEEVKKVLAGTDMVFITAGMGGGTGTGAAPVVAKLAKEAEALTVAIVTKPFAFEGRQRMEVAEKGIEELRKQVDAIIVVPNERLYEVIGPDQTRAQAFNLANDVLRSGVQGISEIITVHGDINVDFADVKSIMSDSGTALLGIGVADGEGRAREAALHAIESPLWEGTIDGAKRVLWNVVASEDLKMSELREAAEVIHEAVDPDATIIPGSVTDPGYEGIRITVVATGFPIPSDENIVDEDDFGMASFQPEEVSFTPPVTPVSMRSTDDVFDQPAIRRRRNSNSIGG